jgi:two-component system response regulator FixJ
VVRSATSFLLSTHGYATEVYASGEEFLSEAKLKRGCILLDLRMHGMSGHEVQEELIRRCATLPVIVMSGHGDLAAAVRAMKLGAIDFLEKPPSEEDLLDAIERAIEAFHKGESRLETKIAAAARVQRLSPREREILRGLFGGLSNKAIARRLDLSPGTVEMHRSRMMDDLGVSSLSEAVRVAIAAEIRPLDEEGEVGAAPIEAGPPANDANAPVADLQAALRESEERLRAALDASGDGGWDWNIATGDLFMSPRFLKRLGYDPDTVAARLEAGEQLVHPDDWPRLLAARTDHLGGVGRQRCRPMLYA